MPCLSQKRWNRFQVRLVLHEDGDGGVLQSVQRPDALQVFDDAPVHAVGVPRAGGNSDAVSLPLEGMGASMFLSKVLSILLC